ncbi:hypothetical protein L249_7224, partial [Ophiocordyceps polyrhachis-furcata BCC 54312]
HFWLGDAHLRLHVNCNGTAWPFSTPPVNVPRGAPGYNISQQKKASHSACMNRALCFDSAPRSPTSTERDCTEGEEEEEFDGNGFRAGDSGSRLSIP